MATEVPMAIIVTVMPTGPIIETSIVRPIDWSVVAIPVMGVAVVVTVVMVINAAKYQCRSDAGPNTPPPSMTMRFHTIGGPQR